MLNFKNPICAQKMQDYEEYLEECHQYFLSMMNGCKASAQDEEAKTLLEGGKSVIVPSGSYTAQGLSSYKSKSLGKHEVALMTEVDHSGPGSKINISRFLDYSKVWVDGIYDDEGEEITEEVLGSEELKYRLKDEDFYCEPECCDSRSASFRASIEVELLKIFPKDS